jgi:FMN phosphatase YigB (HAD superfamily)
VKTIIWDVDDVLNDLMRAWFTREWLPDHPHCTLTYEEIQENPPHRVLNISLEEYLASIDNFRSAKGPQLQLAPAVLGWFQAHGNKSRHAVLTAVPLQAADVWAAWVLKNLGRWVRSFNFVPSLREKQLIPNYDQTKADFLTWWGQGDILVDDNAAALEAARSLGLQTILIPQPWNNGRGSLSDALDELTLLASQP